MTSTPTLLLAAAMALALLPSPATAVPPNRSVSLEATAGGLAAPRTPGVTLSAGGWLEGEVGALARLTVGSAPRTDGRGTAGAVTPEVGLRWAPDEGRWRPLLSVGLGVRLPVAGRATAATGHLSGGVERELGSGWGATASLGVRWLAGERAAGEGALGVRRYF